MRDPAAAPPSGVMVVLLAAGGSSRLGRPKQLIDWRGELLVRRVARRLLRSRARGVVAVLGAAADAVRVALEGLELCCLENARWAEGQSTSVVAGVQAVERCESPPAEGILFAPCDQPFLTTATVDTLLRTFEHHPHRVIRPRYGPRPGAPVLFPAGLFSELSALRGDEGGRAVLRRRPELVLDVAVEEARQGLDIDSPEDLAQCLRLSSDVPSRP